MDKINQLEVNVTFSTVFKMNCSVESYPPAMVHWEVDGEQVSDNPEIRTDTRVHEEVTVDTSSRGVIITYTCVAVNIINGVNHSANNSIDVIVQGKKWYHVFCIFIYVNTSIQVCMYVYARVCISNYVVNFSNPLGNV